MRRLLIGLLAVLTTGLISFGAPASAMTDGEVYVVHGIPGVDVDVYVNGALTLEGFAPKDIAGPLALPAGSYDIAIFAAVDTPAKSSTDREDGAVIEASAAVTAGINVSLIAHLNASGTPKLTAVGNNVSKLGAGNARVTVRHMAAAPAVDILTGDTVVFSGLTNGVGSNTEVPAGTIPVTVAAANGGAVVTEVPALKLDAGTNTIVYAIGSLAANSFDLLVQKIDGLGEVTPPQPANSSVYVLHGIPGITVDVYVNGVLTLPAFTPKSQAGPLDLPAGMYSVEIFAATANPPTDSADRSDDAAIDTKAELAGQPNLSLIAHLDADGAPTLGVFLNDLSAIAVGNGRVEIRHTAAAPAVDIVAGGAPVAPFVGLANGGSAAAELPAANYPTGIAAAGSTSVIFDAPVTVSRGTYAIVYAIGSLEGGSFDLMVQSFDGLYLHKVYRGAEGERGEVARLYVAVLGRAPDADGFAYWLNLRQSGVELEDLVWAMAVSPEFEARFGPQLGKSNAEWVDFLYGTVLGRGSDEMGKAYWTDVLDRGLLEQETTLVWFAQSLEYQRLTGTK